MGDGDAKEASCCHARSASSMAAECRSLRRQCLGSAKLRNVAGLDKLLRLIATEEAFLTQTASTRADRVHASNLSHYRALVHAALRYDELVGLLHTVNMDNVEGRAEDGKRNKLQIDLIVSGGRRWVKVIARSAHGLYMDFVGANSRTGRSVDEQALDYLRAARANPHMFHAPDVLFDFVNGLPHRVAQLLDKYGVLVEGERLSIGAEPASSSSEAESEEDAPAADQCTAAAEHVPVPPGRGDCVNLDVTAMLLLVSNLTNGHAHYRFREKGLDAQAQIERIEPAKQKVDKIIEGKELMCCQTAYDKFVAILQTVAGPMEKQRAETELLPRLSVVPDRVSDRVAALKENDRINSRAKTIFGSGDYYRVPTLTASKRVFYSAKEQGVPLAVLLHASRALTEDKQRHATPIAGDEAPQRAH